MFSYCGNNPVLYSDPTGAKRKVWFQLFEDHDPGYIHRAVQVHILTTQNIESVIYKSEFYMPGIGFADIVCLETGEMWEIKHGGSGNDGYHKGIDAANERLEKYETKGCVLRRGSANRFHGGFTISFDVLKYLVSYTTPEPGIILYTITRINNYQNAADFVYSPHTLYQEQKTAATLIALAFLGAAMEPFPQQSSLLGE